MTKQQLKRHIENQRYMAEKKAAGYQVATFLVPTAICEDVRNYIRARSQELLKQE
jgi:hypothetical protein